MMKNKPQTKNPPSNQRNGEIDYQKFSRCSPDRKSFSFTLSHCEENCRSQRKNKDPMKIPDKPLNEMKRELFSIIERM